MISVRQAFSTEIVSIDDDPAAQAFDSYDLVCDAIKTASKLHLDIDNPFANAFPGDR